MDTESGVGLELVERQISLTLFNELNDELNAQQALWQSRDENWNSLTGKDPDYVLIEEVLPENFHNGHRPSLILNPVPENYPNVSVMVYEGRPSADIYDQASNFSLTCDIELMVKGEKEEEVNARTHRTTDAVHNVLTRNSRLDGLTSGWENDPVVITTDIFRTDDDWLWQATRLRYVTTKHNKLPNWA